MQVRLPDGEPVAVGRYGRSQEEVTAAEAVCLIRELGYRVLGWEVFLPRAVARGEVRQVRAVRQVAGWRYFPGAHRVAPCVCAGCVQPGTYGSRRLRERRPHPVDGPAPASRVLLARLDRAEARVDTAALRDTLRLYGLRRRGPVERFAPLAAHPDAGIRQELTRAVARWSTPGADPPPAAPAGDADGEVRLSVAGAAAHRRTRAADLLLAALGRDPSPAVREAAVEGLVACGTPAAAIVLAPLADDPDASVRTAVALLTEE
ncbi:HEAT repeat domain-containing protein [Streptomyces roseolus]|uniref:HEAT repeat domain-containing protein n=1 Tax=Streptomyces roseolus TaxID=67358 RepID=UPI0037ADA8D3